MNNNARKDMVWKWFWIINFMMQFLLFRSYCFREIIPYIPENMDQVGYIGVSYHIYDMFLAGEYVKSFIYALNSGPYSGMLFIGAINLFVFGFSRFSLLLPNFIAFFLCQFIVSKILLRITNSRYVALIYYGIILLLQVSFAAVGGMFDYRWDFLAFCIYTIWVSYLLEFLYGNEKRAFYCSAIAGGILLYIRLNTILYLGIILLIVFFIKLFMLPIGRKSFLLSWCKYSGILLLSGGWYLLINFKNFLNYYFSALFTSSSREAWQMHMDLKSNILFYPNILRTSLIGEGACAIIVILCIIAITHICFCKKQFFQGKKLMFFTLLVTWLVPYSILTIMDNKNSAASMVLISGLILCPVLLLGELNKSKKIIFPLACTIAIMGMVTFSLRMMSSYPHHLKEDAEGCLAANDVIAGYMKIHEMESAEIIFDRLHTNFFHNTIEVYSRETMERNITIDYAIPSMKTDYVMSTFGVEEIEYGLENTDFLVINAWQYADTSNFSADQILERNSELLKDYAIVNMDLIGEASFEGCKLKIYARRIHDDEK